VGRFAPLARIILERNSSTLQIYNFSRFAGEIGITSAF
jgi:hypothetical protein